MIKQVLAGAVFATAATVAVAVPASAHITGLKAQNTPTNALGSILAAPLGQGTTVSGNGATTEFGTRNGDTVIKGGAGGILNGDGASSVNVDGRCLAPLPEGEGIGGHLLGGLKSECKVAPADQYQAPQKLL
ncbi:hypothetical protein ACIQ9Q_38585 [Streptomyces sp. NPDC094438]|uniref:hypothetical protein n=1 Tax=Streptomyces sp. NPDC094438 TaxID=3366061 RepID=UPI0037F414E3